MIKKSSILLTIVFLGAVCLSGCQRAKVGVDEKQVAGFRSKTFFNDSENVEVTLASDGLNTIVAVPKAVIGRRNQIGDDELSCLAKCAKIADLESRLNCILLCPVSKSYQVFIY